VFIQGVVPRTLRKTGFGQGPFGAEVQRRGSGRHRGSEEENSARRQKGASGVH